MYWCKEKYVEEMVSVGFLGLQIADHLYWNNCIYQVIPKLSGACYDVGLLVHISNINTVIFYFANIYSVLSYGIILWDNSRLNRCLCYK